ncbi:hypothetical protein Ddye_005328 [Dipteronia dyeriana]|uniref:RNase H type-1 domain-containing protein n=1 Tax=Dipteronia dyeriana TaxID=168575 RepID=A0AAE0CPI7_9ROSI|nr:hypothetical protein Ddye_005328 [Dipteronia dyeriana]
MAGWGLVLSLEIMLAISLLHLPSLFKIRVTIDMAEALATFSGLSFAMEVGLLPCMVESDAQIVVRLINDVSIPLPDIGLIFSDIVRFLDYHPGCSVVFAPRGANKAAHCMAKFGVRFDGSRYWLEEASSWLSSIIMGERPVPL